MTINKVILVGRLAAKPEIKQLQTGDPVANFSLATNERWKDKNGEKKEKTEWHRVVVFNKGLCKLLEYTTKGSMLYVEGAIHTRKWMDNSGNDQYTTEIVLKQFNSSLQILSNNSTEGSNITQDEKPQPINNLLDDEIPF